MSTTRYRRGDAFNERGQDLVLVALTSQLTEDSPVTIDPEDCLHGRLPKKSFVKPAKIFTIHSTLVLHRICALRPEKFDVVLNTIRQFSRRTQGRLFFAHYSCQHLIWCENSARRLMKRMKKTHRPLVLTVKRKTEAVLMDPVAYQRLADRYDTIMGIRRGLAEADKGLGQPLEEVFDEIEGEAGLRKA